MWLMLVRVSRRARRPLLFGGISMKLTGIVSLFVIAGIVTLTACAPTPPPPPQQTSLYQRLGGQPAITAVVDDFVANVAADNRINHYFAQTNIPHLKMELVDQICQATGGPCTYTGRP